MRARDPLLEGGDAVPAQREHRGDGAARHTVESDGKGARRGRLRINGGGGVRARRSIPRVEQLLQPYPRAGPRQLKPALGGNYKKVRHPHELTCSKRATISAWPSWVRVRVRVRVRVS